MPARRKLRLFVIKKKKKGLRFSLRAIAFLVISFFVLLFYLFFRFKFLGGVSKQSLVVNSKEGNVVVSSIDLKSEEITNIIIPANTQLLVTRQLGTWKAKSIWQLGVNEGLGGELLRETIIKNFHIPVRYWAESHGQALIGGGFFPALVSLFYPLQTNLGTLDKLKLAVLSAKIPSSRITEIDLGETPMLKQTRLLDGEEGFVIRSKVPEKVLLVFADEAMAGSEIRLSIKDATGNSKVAELVSKTLEVMGVKLVSKTLEDLGDFDCFVSGKRREVVEKVVKLFLCKEEKEESLGNFDLEVKLGRGFARRF